MNKYRIDIPKEMEDIINRHALHMGIVGTIGGIAGPGSDLIAIGISWVAMTIELAREAGHAMSEQTAKKLAIAVATGAGIFIGGTKAAATIFSWLAAPFTGGLSLVANMAANAALNATFTRAYGRSAARFFIQTSKVDDIEMMVKVITALIGIDFGFTPSDPTLLT